MSDFLDTVSGSRTSVSSVTNRYIVGPTIGVSLPFHLGIEFDALYRRFSYSSSANLVDSIVNSRTTSSAWEFPLLIKKSFGEGPLRPFVGAGVNFSKLSGLSQTVQSVIFPSRSLTTNNGNPAELRDDFAKGFVLGAGLDFHVPLLHISPEIRYTRWGSQQFNGIIPSGATVSSNQNQAEFLVGFTF